MSSNLSKSTSSIVVWSDYSRESAAAALATANQFAVVPQGQVAKETVDMSDVNPNKKIITIIEFIRIVEAFDAFITNLEVLYLLLFSVN